MPVMYTIVQGTSEPLEFDLFNDNAPINGAGYSVALSIRRADGANMPAAPVVAWQDQAAGRVRVTGLDGLTPGRYLVRVRLTSGAGEVAFVPNGAEPDVWDVVWP